MTKLNERRVEAALFSELFKSVMTPSNCLPPQKVRLPHLTSLKELAQKEH